MAFACVALAAAVQVSVPSDAGLWVAASLWRFGFAVFV